MGEVTHVWADAGDGPVLAHDTGERVVIDGETKGVIQMPDGSTRNLAYREPSDRDDRGTGGTYWSA